MRRRYGLAPAALLLALAIGACAPATDEAGRVEVVQFAGTPSYYPQEAGLSWSYLRDGARLDDPRYVETVEGPTVVGGDVWTAFRLVGGGQDVTEYRQFRGDGVYLRRQVRPGGSFDFDPPIRELPAPGSMRVGSIWNGQTTATGDFPNAPVGQRRFSQTVDYVYTVVDQRAVTVAERRYDVFVIDRTTRTFDAEGTIVEELTQTLWFAPFVGKVRHENGWFLVATNFEVPSP